MAKIVEVEARHVRYALPESEHIAWVGGTITHRDCVFTRVRTDDGRTGWGEIGEVYFYPQLYIDVVNHRVSEFLVGKDASAVTELHAQLHVLLISLGYSGMAKAVISGIDIALHNLAPPPGPAETSVPVYASTGFAPDIERMCDECRRAVHMGFRSLKIRGGMSVAEDIRRTQAARDCLGAEIGLILELSQSYSYTPYTFDEVVRICRAARECEVLWVEEPFGPEAVALYTQLAQQHLTGIGCGENLYTEEQFRVFGDLVDVCQPDVTRMGGLTSLLRIDQHCKRVAPHQFGTSVALYTLCQHAGKLENLYMLEVDLLDIPIRELIFPNGLRVVDGRLLVDRVDLGSLCIDGSW